MEGYVGFWLAGPICRVEGGVCCGCRVGMGVGGRGKWVCGWMWSGHVWDGMKQRGFVG
jgi:hypothetical protein